MASIMGSAFGFWVVYALISLIFKHKIGIISATILGLVAGISAGIARGDFNTLIGTLICFPLVISLVQLQVNSSKKEEWKAKRKKELSNQVNEEVDKYDKDVEICSECGYQIFPEETKCSNCGKERKIIAKNKIEEQLERTTLNSNDKQQNEIVEKIEQEINENIEICSECGYQIFPEETKCSNCGKERKIIAKKETKKKDVKINVDNSVKQINNQSDKNTNKEKLLELKHLFEEQLITEAEYNEKRKKIIEAL